MSMGQAWVIRHLCPHPIGQNQVVALPRCKGGWGTPPLAEQSLCSNHFYPGKGEGIFGGHWPSLSQMIKTSGALSSCHPHLAGHSLYLQSLSSPFPRSLGSTWLVLMCTKTEHIQGHPEPLSPPLTKGDLTPCSQEHPPSVSPDFQGTQ